MNDNTQHNVTESADKITVTTKVKRGEGTRDEDRIKVKVKGNQADEVVAKLNAVVDNLHDTQDTLRAMQPGDDE